MRLLTTALVLSVSISGRPAEAQTAQRHAATGHSPRQVSACGTPLGFQVRLERAGFSPGELDGAFGENTRRALIAYRHARGLKEHDEGNCATWNALSADDTAEVALGYRITRKDAAGPFTTRIPDDLPSQATLPGLDYTSMVERLGERFHSSPALLQRLNPRTRFAVGTDITVPAVVPFDADASPKRAGDASELSVEVSADTSLLRVLRPDGTVVFAAPVSSGSTHDPLPIGRWTITSVSWRPVFHYNPDLFWDASPSQTNATIQAGPNGPVGVVWIGLDVEHYGIHGTPEPSSVGHGQSHGCVRLTNWDVAKLATLVKVGTPVVFQ